MTTTVPTPTRPRVLRRTRQGRIAAGVSGGLGSYFGVDPVLFRVLFATSAFFGGAGVLAYLLAWAAIPEDGTERAALDDWVARLRRSRVPVWAVAVAGGLLLWAAAASWWAPGPRFAGIAIAGVAIAAVLGRRQARPAEAPSDTAVDGTAPDAAPTVVLEKQGADRSSELRAWVQESRAARRVRARRALPVKLAALLTLVVVLTVLALVDAARGLELQVYFWTTLGIVLLALLVGIALRRTPWSLVALLVVAVTGAAAFGGSGARLHDGVGDRTWTPIAAGGAHYRLAFGRAELDLRSMTGAADVEVTVGAGDVRIIAPRDRAVTVDARVHIGQVEVDRVGTGARSDDRIGDGGVGVHRIVRPPAGAGGAPITVHVQLADGRVLVEHR